MLPAGTILGSTILVHAIYSSYEWVSLHKLLGSQSGSGLPKDVTIEIFIGLLFIILSTIGRGVSRLEPIKVSDLNISKTLAGEEPYAYLETRPNFQDLVAKRKAFLAWRRKESSSS